VQALPSLHGAVLGVYTQPVAGLHESSVHGLASLQTRVTPPQVPALHTSLVVHASPSLQAAELLACTQPVARLQESLVQTFPSLQLGGAPPTHLPALQTSFVVHALPSSQAKVLLTN
jgi:hypothetical protein